jgi:hypothetical protein
VGFVAQLEAIRIGPWAVPNEATAGADETWDKTRQAWGKTHEAWGKTHEAWGNAFETWGNALEAWGNALEAWGNALEAWGNTNRLCGRCCDVSSATNQTWFVSHGASDARSESWNALPLASNTMGQA